MSLIHFIDQNNLPQPYKQSQSVAHNRNINAASSTYAAATNSATWPSTLNIRELSIAPQVTTTQGAAQNSQACLVVYNAPNDAVAAAWLADTGTATSDVTYDMVFTGMVLNRVFNDAVTRVDVLPIGTGNSVMRVVIGAN